MLTKDVLCANSIIPAPAGSKRFLVHAGCGDLVKLEVRLDSGHATLKRSPQLFQDQIRPTWLQLKNYLK